MWCLFDSLVWYRVGLELLSITFPASAGHETGHTTHSLASVFTALKAYSVAVAYVVFRTQFMEHSVHQLHLFTFVTKLCCFI
jgi:hypothetical protein